MLAYVSIPEYSKTIPQRYRLIGMKCKTCGTINFPPKEICIKCGKRTEYETIKLSGRGKVYSFTIIAAGSAPPEFSDQQRYTGPYAVAIIELIEGVRIVAQITDCRPTDLKIDMEVEAVFRRIYEDEGVVRYGLKFRPADTSSLLDS